MKFKIIMTKPNPKPSNPFIASSILETTPTREAELEAESEQAVKDFFEDAKKRGFESVKGFELTRIIPLEPIQERKPNAGTTTKTNGNSRKVKHR